jgi:hypothetical protein
MPVLKRYHPTELGILLKIPSIYVNGCGGDKKHKTVNGDSWAHTHKCPKDPILNFICFNKESYLFNSDGTYSDILWHEYGHVLDSNPQLICGPSNEEHAIQDDYNEHGKKWQRIMILLGRPDINTPWGDLPY